jgi:TonB family protein
MNRLQKKCFIATVGSHLLLIVLLFVGPGFFTSQPKPEDSKVLDIIPSTTIDAAANSGSKSAQPPPPAPSTPIVKPPEPVVQPPPTPPQPQPEAKPPTLEKPPDPDPVKPPKPISDEPKLEPTPKPVKSPPKIILKPVVRNTVTTKNTDNSDAENEAKEQKRIANAKRTAVASALNNIKGKTSSATTVEMPGTSSVSYANYKDAIGTIYYRAWIAPDDTANDHAITKVSITIARDGTIIDYRIVESSGDARVDTSVRKALERVPSVPPLPGGENQRTMSIFFDLKTKRMTG